MSSALDRVTGMDDTIVAISTPYGRGAIGLIRISGPLAARIAAKHLPTARSWMPRSSVRGLWTDAEGNALDDVLATLYPQPHSYTGEDVVEISAHGNPLILERIVESALASGARQAGPGEFTWRAVANGKMDLLQAEAIRDFIDAQTGHQARVALQQMEGGLSRRIRPIKDRLIDLIATFEAAVDFVDDDLETLNTAAAARILEALGADLESLSETYGFGRILAGGLRLVILGKPNVGKSSLFNRIIGQDRAIVTDIPGTTRDVVSEMVAIQGVPLRFCDTAGIRSTSDQVEEIGVARAVDALTEADVALVVLDGSAPLDEEDARVLALVREIQHVVVVNKSDLDERIELDGEKISCAIRLSAKTGEGLPELEARFGELLANRIEGPPEAALTNARQYEAVRGARAALDHALQALKQNTPPEMTLMDLYGGLSHLNVLTGEALTDDILDRVFSKFCVGK
ncbi:MAG TPA: tRNA uridine-5-carboxymethylaminomethyl(34) synthesis GTPase MnmE [Terriglobia bacterium]|nr:tRNA uridine-5-carboxymethylaminomethyl(34) synthesis GTPase MnmE [Terriglobia bacterium]